MKKITTLFLAVLLSGTALLKAESIDSVITNLVGTAAEKYIQPISSSFGANLNTGWVHRPPEAKMFGIDLEVNVIASSAFLSGADKDFKVNTKFQLNREQAKAILEQDPSNWNGFSTAIQDSMINILVQTKIDASLFGPTVIGNKEDSIFIAYEGSNPHFTQGSNSYTTLAKGKKIALVGKAGVLGDLKVIPFAMPQVNVGTLFGTQFAIRYFPQTELSKEIGEVGFFGLGITHNPAVWFGDPDFLPVDLSAGFYFQKLKLGDLLEASTTQYGIYASKTYGFTFLSLTPYAGLAFESFTSTIKYDYEYTNPTTNQVSKSEIKFDLEGENTMRIIVGSAFKLGIFNLNVDYNFAKYSTASVGIGFVI